MMLTRSELATIERALHREYRACFDKRRKLAPSVRALMIVDVKRALEKVQHEIAEKYPEDQS